MSRADDFMLTAEELRLRTQKRRRIVIIALLLVLVASVEASAQRRVTGSVTTTTGEPIGNVVVNVGAGGNTFNLRSLTAGVPMSIGKAVTFTSSTAAPLGDVVNLRDLIIGLFIEYFADDSIVAGPPDGRSPDRALLEEAVEGR